MKKNFSNFERKSLIGDLDLINDKYQKMMSKPDSHLKNAKNALDKMIQRYAFDKLREIPIDNLNRQKNGFRIKTLKDHGIDNYGKFLLLKRDELESFNGISPEKAYLMKSIVKELYSYYLKEYKLSLSIDSLTDDKKTLIKNIHEYIRIKALIDEKTKDIDYDSFIKNFEFFEYNSKFLRYLLISKNNKQKVNDIYTSLLDFKNSKGKLLSESYKTINAYSSSIEEAIEDYQRNSIQYLNVLEQINPGLFAGNDQKFGLSEESYETINQQEILDCGLKCKLRNYQKLGVKFILKHKRVLLGDEMGLGKTIEAIASMVSLRNSGYKRFVVICPASVLVNWQREIEKHSDLRPCIIHRKSLGKSLKEWQTNGGVAVVTFGTSEYICKSCSDLVIDMLVVDEAHYVKNPKAARTSTCDYLCKHSDYVLFMTGTAIENNVEEMKNLLSMLNYDFISSLPKEALINPPMFVRRVSDIYYRRKREDVLNELPELTETDEWCTPTTKDWSNYTGSVLSKYYAGARQVAWLHNDLSKSSKAQRLFELVEEAKLENRKVVIFSFFLNTINALKEHFSSNCYGPINGSLSSAKRQEIIDEFEKAPEGSILLSQIMAGGTGLNIQTASVVIICEPQFKPSTENQAISRSYRMGQTRNVFVYRLLCKDTIDEGIRQVLFEKQQIFDAYADKSLAAQLDTEINENQFNSIMEREYSKISKLHKTL